MRCPWLAILLTSLTMNAFAQDPDQRFCIAPVKNGAAGDGPAGETWRLSEAPVWFDEAGVPRYEPFSPRLLNNICANEAALAW
jgi:hypothetical protein